MECWSDLSRKTAPRMRWLGGLGWLLILCCLLACSQPIQTVFVQAGVIQLSKPDVQITHLFFKDQTSVLIGTPPADCRIYMANTKGVMRPVEAGLMSFSDSQQLRLQTRGGGFIPSEELELEVIKMKSNEVQIASGTPAQSPYNKSSLGVLLDQKKAGVHFKDTGWLGFQGDTIHFELTLDEAPLSGIAISCLQDQQSWIFTPQHIKAIFYDAQGELLQESQYFNSSATIKANTSFEFLKLAVAEIRPTRMELWMTNIAEIPAWHPAKGNAPWLFIDEIIIQ